MKTVAGWIRGRLCGKQSFAKAQYVCVLCGRAGMEEYDLCFPVKQ